MLRSSKSMQPSSARSFKFNDNGSMVDLRCADTFQGSTLAEEDPELVRAGQEVAAVEPTSSPYTGGRVGRFC